MHAHKLLVGLVCGLVLMGAGANARADLLDVAQRIHTHGCTGRTGLPTPFLDSLTLTSAAQHWSRGTLLHQAILQSGYRETKASAIHISGDERAMADALTSRFCVLLTDRTLTDVGAARHGNELWIILAAPFNAPTLKDSAAISAHLLALVNQARAHARHCGSTAFAAAPALSAAPLLSEVALHHAQDMAQWNYFAHEDRSGQSPADRVRQTGYRERLVGENIALGAMTADEAVRGWLDSPGHCENLMNPQFSEMGVGFAVSSGAEPRIYWVQDFAAPR